ncbi:MAG: FliM/FliN family flagellar motor switch protein [Paracoccaceae bacterium]
MAGGVLRKMLRPAARAVPSPADAPGRIWGNALARAAQDLLDLPVFVGRAGLAGVALVPWLAAMPKEAMLLGLDGPEGARGLALLGPDVVAALIEMHMMRRMRAAPGAGRTPTRIEAAVIVPLVEQALELVSLAGAGVGELAWMTGWEGARFVADPRPLGLTMPDVSWRELTVTIELGLERQRGGTVGLVLPERAGAAGLPEARLIGDWQERIETAGMAAGAEVKAVLCRIRLPLAEAVAFAPGTEVALPDGALDGVRIEGRDGKPVAGGRLGQIRNRRAVRIRPLEEGGGAEEPGASAALPPAAGLASPWGLDGPGDPVGTGLPEMSPAGDPPPWDVGGGGLPEIATGTGELPGIAIGGFGAG